MLVLPLGKDKHASFLFSTYLPLLIIFIYPILQNFSLFFIHIALNVFTVFIRFAAISQNTLAQFYVFGIFNHQTIFGKLENNSLIINAHATFKPSEMCMTDEINIALKFLRRFTALFIFGGK